MIRTNISKTARPIRTLLLITSVAGLVAACGDETSDSFIAASIPTGTDAGLDLGVTDVGGNGTLGTATLGQIVALPRNSEPMNDELDQVEADLLNTLGTRDGEPFTVSDDDTVGMLLVVEGDR